MLSRSFEMASALLSRYGPAGAIVVRPKSEGQRNLSVSILNRLVRDRTYSFERLERTFLNIFLQSIHRPHRPADSY